MPRPWRAVSWGHRRLCRRALEVRGQGRAGQAALLPCRFRRAVRVLAFQGDRAEQAGQLLQKKRGRVLQILKGDFPFPAPRPPGLGCADADALDQ